MSKKIIIKPANELRKQKVEEIIDNWITGAEKNKNEKNEIKNTSRLNANIPSDLYYKVKMYCAQNKTNITDLVTNLLTKEVL